MTTTVHSDVTLEINDYEWKHAKKGRAISDPEESADRIRVWEGPTICQPEDEGRNLQANAFIAVDGVG